jgi:hypothetical protein
MSTARLHLSDGDLLPSEAITTSARFDPPERLRALDKPFSRCSSSRSRQPWSNWPVPLTVLAELLYRDSGTPYRAAKKFGLREWLSSQVRCFLTQGAWFAGDLDLERAIRFNTAYLVRRAQFVEHRRGMHRGQALDGTALAKLLGLPETSAIQGFFDVWRGFVGSLAEELVLAARDSHAGEVPWVRAEQFLDRAVAPRPRKLGQAASKGPPGGVGDQDAGLVSLTSGLQRFQFLLQGLSSSDPAVVLETLNSWQARRLFDKDDCGLPAWGHDLGDL